MRIFVEAQSEMTEGFGGVARLLERTQHEVGDDAFFRLVYDLSNEPLVMLRRNPQFRTGKGDLQAALSAMAVGVGAAGFSGGGDASVTHGNFSLVQIFDSQRIAKRARQFFEFQDFARVGFFVHAMERFDAALEEIARDGAVGGEHELFDQAMRDVALAARNIGHALLLVELDDRLGEVEIDGTMLITAGVEEQGEFLHVAEMRRESRVALGHLGVAFKHFVDIGVGHALGGANDAGSHAGRFHAAGGIEFHQRAHDQAIFARFQRTHAAGKSLGKHGHGAIGKIDGGPSKARFLVKCAAGSNVMRDVRDVDLEVPASISAMLDVDGIVKVARGFAVNGDDGKMAKILAPVAIRIAHRLRTNLRFLQSFSRERMREVVFADDNLGVNAEFAGTAEYFNDPARGGCAPARITHQLDVDNCPVELLHARDASSSDACFIRAAEAQFLPKTWGQLLTTRYLHFVLDSNVIGQDRILMRAVAKQPDDRRMRPVQNANNAPFGALRAGGAAEALDFGQHVVAMHRVFDRVARDEDVTIKLRQGSVRHDKTITVVMDHQTSFYLAGSAENGALDLLWLVRSRPRGGCFPIRLAGWEAVSPARQFLDGAAFLEFCQ